MSNKRKKIFNKVIYAVDVVIFNRLKSILMLKRNDPFEEFKTGWEYVKGGVKEDETYLDAAIREISEETGVKVELISKIDKTFKVDARYRKRSHYDFVKKKAFVFLYIDGNVTLSPTEHINYKWMDYEKAHELIWVDFSKEILETAFKIYNTKIRN